MEAAQQLLMTASSVKAVAYEVNYKHPGHFCRAFKRYHGMTPSEYVVVGRDKSTRGEAE